ncbi:hypothetical protein OS493_038244 [Desmophyllum pertusum]|uniref:DUF7869 domain-containing protein n=1 Tax=Desmophyllum pertusum TaxID=174260 RepID=A0A9X0CPK9_9CNID|nr:hypothetical protein OS493_038244 [Desmophyllum pertusum]
MEECQQDFPTEVVKQNQFVLNLLHQFGNGNAATENELEDVTFTIMGRSLCEDCLCILFDVSDSRYQRIKNFYRVGSKVIYHGNNFHHPCKTEQSYKAGAWLDHYLDTYSEPMPHVDIFHLHVPSKKAVFNDKPTEVEISESLLYKLWNNKVKIPTKNHIFARCPQCQGLRKRCFEAGKCAAAIEALKEERRQHKDLYMAEKQDYYNRSTRSVNHPDDVMCIIYDGMHKEKTKLPRFSKNPSKDLEAVYGNTLLVHHTHEDVDRMFENGNEHFRKADMVTPNELSIQMKKVPFVCEAKPVPCVWDISSFITPFLRMVHDFGNVHHFWLHKSVEGSLFLNL